MLRKPIQSVMVRCFSDEKSEGDAAWWVPNFEMKGFVSADLYNVAKNIAEKQADYNTEYNEEDTGTEAF